MSALLTRHLGGTRFLNQSQLRRACGPCTDPTRMTGPAGALPRLAGQAYSVAESALPGAGSVADDVDAAVDSPAPASITGGQTSVAVEASPERRDASPSTLQWASSTGVEDSALSVADLTGSLVAARQSAKPARRSFANRSAADRQASRRS